VLIVDDDRDMRWAMRNILLDAGFDVSETDGGGAGLEMAGHRKPAAVLLDMRMPGLSGEETLQGFKRLDPALPIIVVTGHGSIPGAVSAIRNGAFEYVTKPFRNDHLVETVRRAVGRRSVGPTAPISGVGSALVAAMGQGRAIRTLVAQVEAVVSTQYSVVISGETGAGKEVVARCLHDHGPRANHPLIVIDCGAIAETLTDSEFFGHEKGAFTGANERRRGCIESAAKGGTIFLDEVGNLAPTGQKALLRTLENRTLRRVGGTELIDLDMRVIAASNDDLKARAKTGAFREDLFFRLAEYVITVPPLRSRAEDIPFLAQRFLTQAREALKRPTAEIDPAAIDRLCSYRWPGNVRELRTVMRRAALIRSDRIAPADIADSLGDGDCAVHALMAPDVCISLPQRIRGQVNAIERDAIVAALKQAMGNKAKAARLLGIDYKTYRTKLKMLGTEHEAAADEQG
jgi:two-component system nitrogen regulation response regulator GlnG